MTTDVPGPAIATVRDALATAGRQFAEMLRLVVDPGRPAIGEWSVGETAAHVASSAPFFLAVARGEMEPESLDEVAAVNAAFLASDSERDPPVLAERFAAGESALLAYVEEIGANPEIEVFRGAVAPLSTLLAVELGEVLVHGHDIARASGLAWPIGRAQAVAATGGLLPLLPHMVHSGAAAGRRLRFELRVRGGERAVLDFDDGTLRILRSEGQSVDCRLSVDPAAFLLLSYGRIGPVAPMLQGKLAAWGRRPWLGASLASLFRKI
jgi:uncharacterized protein (TIGR03083 family)